MPSPDDLIQLVEFVRNHVDSFRILEIKVAALVATLEAAEKENPGLYASYIETKRFLRERISTEETKPE